MVRVRHVLVDCLLHEPHAEYVRVEVQVRLRVAGNGRDVMDSADLAHQWNLTRPSSAWRSHPRDRNGRPSVALLEPRALAAEQAFRQQQAHTHGSRRAAT